MATKILLAKPDVKHPVKKQGQHGDMGIPLGLLYLASYIRKYNDSEVTIRDYRLEHVQGKTRNLEEDFKGHDIVGVSACTSEAPDALHILERAKKEGKTTLMGGLYPTSNITDTLNTGFVDYVIRGEGEVGLSNLIQSLEGRISLDQTKGISHRQGTKNINNPDQPLIMDMDTLPLPAYDLIDVDEYREFTSSAPLYSGRGCPLPCKFCTLNEMWNFKYRARSTDSILEELEMLRGLGFDRVHFKDETITLNKGRVQELFGEIERANLGLKYKTKSRVNDIDPETVQAMVRAGVDTIHTGIESVSQASLRSMKKGYNARRLEEAFDTVIDNGSNINPVYMFSWVGETEEDLLANAEFIKRMGQRDEVITYVSFVTPHPGSGIDNMRGLEVLSRDLSRYTHKQPVAVPISLGANGLRMVVDQYHEIGRVTRTQDLNPRIDPVYLEGLEKEMKGGRVA